MQLIQNKLIWIYKMVFQKRGVEGKEKGDHEKLNKWNVEFVENRTWNCEA